MEIQEKHSNFLMIFIEIVNVSDIVLKLHFVKWHWFTILWWTKPMSYNYFKEKFYFLRIPKSLLKLKMHFSTYIHSYILFQFRIFEQKSNGLTLSDVSIKTYTGLKYNKVDSGFKS